MISDHRHGRFRGEFLSALNCYIQRKRRYRFHRLRSLSLPERSPLAGFFGCWIQMPTMNERSPKHTGVPEKTWRQWGPTSIRLLCGRWSRRCSYRWRWPER